MQRSPMGPYHGKLVIHMPSGSLGIASSRKIPSPKDERESWSYSLRCADRTRTPFFQEREVRLATASQKSRFEESRRILALRRLRGPRHSGSGPAPEPASPPVPHHRSTI